MTRQRDNKLILLTGATGYVGGRLLRVLEHQGHRVRCLAGDWIGLRRLRDRLGVRAFFISFKSALASA